MFIRHAEKPGDDGPPHGVDQDGERDPHSLSVRGWTRAGALAVLFAHPPASLESRVVTPERIVATKSTPEYRSKRERHTAKPTAHRLNLTIDSDYGHADSQALCQSILSDPRPTLVVWHHGSLVDLIQQFPVANRGDLPQVWPEDRFDLMWVLVRDAGEADFHFTAVALELLRGDSPSTNR